MLILVGGITWFITRGDDKAATTANPVVKEYQQQLPDLKKKVQDEPKSAAARVNYAIALYATGDVKAAKGEYEKATELDPKNATVFNNLGNVYRDLGELDKAVEAYNKAMTLNSKLINPYFNLANIQQYNQKDVDAAIATYQKALKALPDNEQVLLSLGIAYENKNDKTKAEQVYRSILAKDADNAVAFSPEGSQISVASQSSEEGVELTITDHGPGLPTEVKNTILQPFTHPGDEMTESHQGLGLSLYLDALIMRHLGGDIQFEQTPGGGTTVRLSLPNQA